MVISVVGEKKTGGEWVGVGPERLLFRAGWLGGEGVRRVKIWGNCVLGGERMATVKVLGQDCAWCV